MKIATWNVNSVRSRLDRLLRWLEKVEPDVVCLQEIKGRVACLHAAQPRVGMFRSVNILTQRFAL